MHNRNHRSIFLLAASLLAFATPVLIAEPISVPDAVLRAKLENQLGLNPGDPIQREAMEGLTSLYYSNSSLPWDTGDIVFSYIADLTGLEAAVNLESLNLFNHNISDITPLANLTQLRTLILHGNAITDASPLAGLTQLQVLVLGGTGTSPLYDTGGNAITSIAWISGLIQLEQLGLRDNQITDLTPLSTLTQLRDNILYNPDGSVFVFLRKALEVSLNYVDLSPGSTDTTLLDTLVTSGTIVRDPQKTGNYDRDWDGLPDAFEESIIYADPIDAYRSHEEVLPNEDIDGDGFTNREEVDAGTDPLDILDLPMPVYSITVQLSDGVGRWRVMGESEWLSSGATFAIMEGTEPPAFVEFEELPDYWTPQEVYIPDFSAGSETIQASYFMDPEPASSGDLLVETISIGRNQRTEMRGGFPDASMLTGTYYNEDRTTNPAFWTLDSGLVSAPKLPGAGTRGSFIIAQDASQARDFVVGRAVDANNNLLPAIWHTVSSSPVIDVLPLPPGLNPSTQNYNVLGRAVACNPAGSAIAGQVLVGTTLEGAVWTWDSTTETWNLTTTSDITILDADYMETWLYAIADSGNIAAGWVNAYFDGYTRLETTPFVWEDGATTPLPTPPGTTSAEAKVITGNGSQLAGNILIGETGYLGLWEKDSEGGWTVTIVDPPAGYQSFDVSAYIDGNSRSLAGTAYDGTRFVPYIYSPGSGFTESAAWMQSAFGASFGAEWMPNPYFADPSTGVAYGMLTTGTGNVMAFAVLPPPPAFTLTVTLRDDIGRWRPQGTELWLDSDASYALPYGSTPPLSLEFEPVDGYWTPPSYRIFDFSAKSQTMDFAYFASPVPVSGTASVDLVSKGLNVRTEVRGGFRDGSVLTGTYFSETNAWVAYAWTPASGMVDLPKLPGAGTRSSLLTAAGASLDNNTIIGRAVDSNDNLVPVIWTYDAEVYSIATLPLSPTIDASTFSNAILGRALFINQKGDTIIGQTLTSSGFIEGALWRQNAENGDWVLSATTGTSPFAASLDYLEVWPYALAEDGTVVAGWAFVYTEGFTVYQEMPFVWEGQNLSQLPSQPGADNTTVGTISGDGRQIAGVSSTEGIHSLSLWNKAGDNSWVQTIVAPPPGYLQYTPSQYINPFSKTISGYTYDGIGFEQWMYVPGEGFLPSAGWIQQHFGVSFGSDWMPEIVYADLATGMVFGRISTYLNHMMGYRIIDPPSATTMAASRFIQELPEDRRDPLDENGPLSVPNIIAYALGLHPEYITPERMPTASTIQSDGHAVISTSIPVNKAATDVMIIAEVSSTMAPDDWHSDPENLTIVETPEGIQVIDKIPFSATQPRFLRFRVVPME